MRIASGPRPWPIHLFALLFTAQGAYSFLRDLSSLATKELILQAQYPAFDWDQDWVIVWLSAWFTIVLIPVVGVWMFANRWARLLVTIMALAALPRIYRFAMILGGDYPAEWEAKAQIGFVQNAAILVAVGLLYLKSVSFWLRQEKAHVEQVFG